MERERERGELFWREQGEGEVSDRAKVVLREWLDSGSTRIREEYTS